MNPLDDKEKKWLSSHTKFHLGLTVDEILELKELVKKSHRALKPYKVYASTERESGEELPSQLSELVSLYDKIEDFRQRTS